jgi:NADH-quinone oxidoreductase subunit J
MTLFGTIFYILAFILVASTVLAITRRQAIHAVIYLIISFVATGMIFYLLGAPFLAALEVIIYAGAIMVLFLFILMMLRITPSGGTRKAALAQWAPAIILGAGSLMIAAVMVFVDPAAGHPLKTLRAGPAELGRFLFREYWFPVEIASFLLLIALVGAFYLGRQEKKPGKVQAKESL